KLGKPLHWEFDEWAARLRSEGVTSVRTVALDDGIFDLEGRHPEWDARQAAEWYQAPVGGLNFNDNCLDARIRLVIGEVSLMLSPPLPPSFIRNTVRLGKKNAPFGKRTGSQDIFEYGGSVARDNTQVGPV